MKLLKLGKKTGIAGIVLGALGFGGASWDASQSEEVPQAQVEMRENLEDAVNELNGIIQSGKVITGTVRDTAETIVESTKEQVAVTREEITKEVRTSLQNIVATVASSVAGIVGTFLAALGFRNED